MVQRKAVSSKKARSPNRTQTPQPLRPRIDRSVGEGRYQQALELAKQLHKEEPTASNRELLHTIYLSRATQLKQTGNARDAINVLHAALVPPGLLPPWKVQIAERLAGCGDIKGAMQLCSGEDAAQIERLLPHAADAAVSEASRGRSLLPESMQADFDRVILAFQQLEAGQDNKVRDT